MANLTDHRKVQAREIFDRYNRELHDTGAIENFRLESELLQLWGISYQSLKPIMIDIVRNHPEYEHLAVYYMERSGSAGVVSEFQRHLARIYGLSSYHDDEREAKRAAYWKDALEEMP